MPSFDEFHPVDFSILSRNVIQKLVNSMVPWRPFFIIDGFPRGCWWFSLSTTNQSISLMFDFKIIYSHGMKCIGSLASKTLEYYDTALLTYLLPGCDWSYVHLTLVYIASQIHSVLGCGYGHHLVADPQCMSGDYTRHDSFLSWIHNVFLMAMTSSVESCIDLRCIFGSCAQSSFLTMYNSSPEAFLVQG